MRFSLCRIQYNLYAENGTRNPINALLVLATESVVFRCSLKAESHNTLEVTPLILVSLIALKTTPVVSSCAEVKQL